MKKGKGISKVRFEKVLDYLKKNGITKSIELSKATGIPESTISDYMRVIRKKYTFFPIHNEEEMQKYFMTLKDLIRFVESKEFRLDKDRVLVLKEVNAFPSTLTGKEVLELQRTRITNTRKL